MSEIELILTKLKIVSEEKERGMYLCDKEHSKILLDYIQQKENKEKEIREYIENKEFINYKKGLGNFERMLKHRQDLLEILDKENK